MNGAAMRSSAKVQRLLVGVVGPLAGAVTGLILSPTAQADAVAYLVNVTVRPGYHFANADAALQSGHRICGKVAGGQGLPEVTAAIGADFGTSDDYHAMYLINQAVNELCPGQIWNLRRSAAGYRPGSPS